MTLKKKSFRHTIKRKSARKRTKKTRKNIKRQKNKSMKGGKKAALSQSIYDVQYSEKKLIKQHKKTAAHNAKFYDIYNKHILNLKKLDAFLPKLNSFQELFTDVLMPNDIKPNLKVKMNNPLLLNQYNITEYSTPLDISTEHVKQQIKYCMFKNFNPQDSKVITDVDVVFDESIITIKFTLNNFRETTRQVQHIGYMLDMNSLIEALKSVLEDAKGNIDYNYKPKTFSSDEAFVRISPMHKSAKKQQDVELLGNSDEPRDITKEDVITSDALAKIVEDDKELQDLVGLAQGLNNSNKSN